MCGLGGEGGLLGGGDYRGGEEDCIEREFSWREKDDKQKDVEGGRSKWSQELLSKKELISSLSFCLRRKLWSLSVSS